MAATTALGNNTMEAHYTRGERTLRVPMSLFRKNRDRRAESLRKTPGVPASGAFVRVQGGEEVPFNDTDINYECRQCGRAKLPGSSRHRNRIVDTLRSKSAKRVPNLVRQDQHSRRLPKNVRR